jgi:hypothetical protein
MTNNEEAEYEWGLKAAKQVRDTMTRLNITYKSFSEALKEEGLEYTPRQIEGKIYRGSLKAAHYFIFMNALNKHFHNEVNPHVIRKKAILGFCITPRSRQEIQDMIGIRHREHFYNKILRPLLKEKKLIRTIPEAPRSPLQQYKTIVKD